MYETFRNELSAALLQAMDAATVNQIMQTVDIIGGRYDFQIKETAIIPYSYQTPAAVKMFIACKTLEGKAAGTLQSYELTLKAFFASTGKAVTEITTNDIRIYLYSYQQRKGVSNRTLDKYRDYINSFFVWCVSEELRPDNPCAKIPKIKYEQKQREALTQTELEYIRTGCRSLRDKAIIELLYSTGCRVSEIVNIKLSDMDLHENSILVTGKGNKQRTVFLNARAQVAIEQYLKSRKGTSPYLIAKEKAPYTKCDKRAIELIVKQISERAGTRTISPHILRHTTATTALNNGMRIETISKMLGHSSVSTTMIYAQCSDQKLHQEHIKCVI